MKKYLRKPSGEDGMTLAELLVAMGVLSILMTVSMAAILTMTKSTVRTQAVADSTDDVRVTFQRLDKEIRYASAINQPGMVGEDQYVEYLVNASAAEGTPLCVQWRYVPALGEVQRREWPLNTADSTPWQTLVNEVRNDMTVVDQIPFTLLGIGTVDGKNYSRQQLEVFIDAGMGESRDTRGGQLDVTFTALNSSKSSPASVCMNSGVGRS